MKRSMSCLMVCLLAAWPLRPADAAGPLLTEAIALAGPVMWLSSGAPGLVLGLVHDGDTIVAGYGSIRPKDDQSGQANPPPDGRTLLRLGSISKVFAGELLAGLAAEGRVRLTDPLQRYLPADTSAPRFGTRAITLLDLATYSAALPREMGDAPDGAAPFTWPTRAERFAWLAKAKLGWAPGSIALYSNVGFDLLGDALENAAGASYATLLAARITGPLGMADTTLTPSAEQCARMMQGTGIGAPAAPACTDTEATQASGGLYSTGADMVRWVQHNLDRADAATWPTLALAHAVYRQRQEMTAASGFDEAGPMAGLALGWVMQAAHGAMPMLLAKSGGGGGFMTYVAIAPGRGTGVFVAVNRLDFPMFAGLTAAANGLIADLVTR